MPSLSIRPIASSWPSHYDVEAEHGRERIDSAVTPRREWNRSARFQYAPPSAMQRRRVTAILAEICAEEHRLDADRMHGGCAAIAFRIQQFLEYAEKAALRKHIIVKQAFSRRPTPRTGRRRLRSSLPADIGPRCLLGQFAHDGSRGQILTRVCAAGRQRHCRAAAKRCPAHTLTPAARLGSPHY